MLLPFHCSSLCRPESTPVKAEMVFDGMVCLISVGRRIYGQKGPEELGLSWRCHIRESFTHLQANTSPTQQRIENRKQQRTRLEGGFLTKMVEVPGLFVALSKALKR